MARGPAAVAIRPRLCSGSAREPGHRQLDLTSLAELHELGRDAGLDLRDGRILADAQSASDWRSRLAQKSPSAENRK